MYPVNENHHPRPHPHHHHYEPSLYTRTCAVLKGKATSQQQEAPRRALMCDGEHANAGKYNLFRRQDACSGEVSASVRACEGVGVREGQVTPLSPPPPCCRASEVSVVGSVVIIAAYGPCCRMQAREVAKCIYCVTLPE